MISKSIHQPNYLSQLTLLHHIKFIRISAPKLMFFFLSVTWDRMSNLICASMTWSMTNAIKLIETKEFRRKAPSITISCVSFPSAFASFYIFFSVLGQGQINSGWVAIARSQKFMVLFFIFKCWMPHSYCHMGVGVRCSIKFCSKRSPRLPSELPHDHKFNQPRDEKKNVRWVEI